tara:strand:+ start:880 stop:1095 length:216 start_codon:yes stop_codon:yes gene_type:complete
MSKLFDEAENIVKKEKITVEDYKKIKSIERKIEEDEEKNFAWLLEAFELKLSDLIEREGNDNFLEEEDNLY